MNSLRFIAPFALLIQLCAAAEAPPAKALKYHEVLLKRPSSETLFNRFFGAWIDEQDVDSLQAFLTARAANNGGADLAVLASFQLRRGNEDAALATFGKAIAALPQDFSLPMERAKIHLRRLEFESARKDLEVVCAGTDALLALESAKLIGKSWLREGKSEQAIKAWNKLLASHPNDEDLLEDLVESAAAEGETEQALKFLDKLIAAGSDPYKKTLRQLRRGDLLAKAGRHDDAVAAYSATLADAGEGSWLEREILTQIDKTFRRQDRIGELKDKLAELAKANPNRLLIHRELARIEAAQGETDAAIGRFRDVLKRTPGNRELRQEFVRLLTDGEKYQEASTELQNLIALAPTDSSLLLQMADLRNRQNNKEATLAALEKALAVLGSDDESAGVRISGLMFQYGLGEAGEKLLLKLTAKPNATEAPSEALAAEYARANRKPEALAILEKIAATDNLETLLRAAGTLSALGQPATALKVLSVKQSIFDKEPRFLGAISQAALAAGMPDVAVTHSVKLVRIAAPGTDLRDSIAIALRAIADAKKTDEWRNNLEKQATRTAAETCLLASLADSQYDFDAVTKIMDGTKDPVLIRFHATLLDRRNEFDQAITVLKALADTPEGRKSSYFKDLADLQRRAGHNDDALATVELWKQRAPGDKLAWVSGSSILRDEGRYDEAVKATRQAVARFEEDKDLAATLASLHEEAGQMENAEAIYWRLYDQAESPSDQARWSVRLAELSLSTGRTEELEDKLRERARSNRRSIGPILAQAELARITRDEEKRRDLLLEAVRLQPKDIDLRLQIANLEEQSGNPERAIAVLEEAAPTDATNGIRKVLAQAYLRQGQTLKGLRELRTLAGKQADDPRFIEQSAAALAASGLYDEAIRFMRETLPDGGDWSTRYLLAVMLEHDGRESEAIPIFQALRQTTSEIPSLVPAIANQRNQQSPWDEYPESVRKIVGIMSSAQAAYMHRNPNNYQGGYNQGNRIVGSFMLPDSVESLHSYCLVHLTKLGVEGLENNAFLKELISTESLSSPDFGAMLKKYPEQPGLLALALIYSQEDPDSTPIDPDLLRKLIASRKDLSSSDLFKAKLMLATSPKADQSAWDELIAAVKPLKDAKAKDQDDITPIAYQLLQLLTEKGYQIPEKSRKELTEITLEIASSRDLVRGSWEGMNLAIFSSIGTTEQWITAVNKEIQTFRKEEPQSQQPSLAAMAGMYTSNMGGINNPFMAGGGSPFTIPSIENTEFSSIPTMISGMIRPLDPDDPLEENATMDPDKLLAKIDSISSPLLRAWIAKRAGDKAAFEKALKATPPEIETSDFASLRALDALEKKDYATAYKLVSGQRSAHAADRNRITMLNFQLLAIAAEMSAEQRKEISQELAQLLIQSRRSLGNQAAPILAAQAERLDLPDLAKRFLPATAKQSPAGSALGAATFGTSSPIVPTSSGNPTIDKLKKFSTEGKNEAAALEALNLIRKNNQNPYRGSYELHELREVITPAVLTELMKLTEPGNSESLTKLTEYTDICISFGKPELAVPVLNRLQAARPKDPLIAAKLAFTLPATERVRAIELISLAANDPSFAEIAFDIATNLSGDNNDDRTFQFFETTAEWLETAKPENFEKTNLTWAPYHGKNFFEAGYLESCENLSETDPSQQKNNKNFQRFVAIAKRLCLAMLRHPSIAEEGFRLTRFSRAWKFSDTELDQHARTALMAGAELQNTPASISSFFRYRRGGGSSSSGDDLAELSSVAWITARLATAKSPDAILPPAYIAQLREKNLDFGNITSALGGFKDVAEFEKLWKSSAFTKLSGPFAEMLHDGVLNRASSIPGASTLFLKLLEEIKPSDLSNQDDSNQTNSLNLMEAALKSLAEGEAKDLTAVCSVISKLVFGENIDFSKTNKATAMEKYQAIGIMDSIFREADIDPTLAIRIQKSFYRLGVPTSTSVYALSDSFRKLKAKNPAEAEKIFASLGWLDPAETWQPFTAIIADSTHTNGIFGFNLTETFLVPHLIRYIETSNSPSDLIKFLEKRQPQTFGALITAACLAEPAERARLTALAFSTNAAKLASLPPERHADFSLLLPWLPKDAMASLPPSFRKKAECENADRIKKLKESAEAFLKSYAGNNNSFGHYPFDAVQELIRELAPLDLSKATEVFLETERRFTDQLSRGGRLSSYITSGLQITERDEAFESIFSDSDQALNDPALALAFHQAVASSAEASRFTFSTDEANTPVLSKIGYKLFNAAPKGTNPKEQQWMRALKNVQSLPEDLRTDGYLALTIYLIERNTIPLLRNHYTPDDLKALSEEARIFHTIAVGARNWSNDKPDQREATHNALIAVATNPAIAFPSRFQFISMAITSDPNILSGQAITETYTAMFEEYAKGQRSIVNSIGLHSAVAILFSPAVETSKLSHSRINKAFWENANTRKAGGHPTIPDDFSGHLLISAAVANDAASTQKLLPVAKKRYLGDISTIHSLIAAGQYDIAKQMLAPANHLYRIESRMPLYTKSFEQRFKEFTKTPGLDALASLRFEAMLMDACPSATDGSRPLETDAQREQHIIESYLANPPKDPMHRIEIVARLIRDSHTAAIALHDEVIALSKALPLKNALHDWYLGTGSSADPAPRHIAAPNEAIISRQAAFLRLLDGDASGLADLVQVMEEQSPAEKYHPNGSQWALRQFHERVCTSAFLWIAEAVHLDKTQGFADAFEAFEKLTLMAEKRPEMKTWDLTRAVTSAEFLAYWTGQTQKFENLRKQIKRYAREHSHLSSRWGLVMFVRIAIEHKKWKHPSFAETRLDFIAKAFSRKEMTDYYGAFTKCLSGTVTNGQVRADILKIAEKPPEGIVPTALTQLLFYYSNEEFNAKRIDSGIANALAAINACPENTAWNGMRYEIQAFLMDKLLAHKKFDLAKEVYANFKTETLNDAQKKRHKELGDKLNQAPQ